MPSFLCLHQFLHHPLHTSLDEPIALQLVKPSLLLGLRKCGLPKDTTPVNPAGGGLRTATHQLVGGTVTQPIPLLLLLVVPVVSAVSKLFSSNCDYLHSHRRCWRRHSRRRTPMQTTPLHSKSRSRGTYLVLEYSVQRATHNVTNSEGSALQHCPLNLSSRQSGSCPRSCGPKWTPNCRSIGCMFLHHRKADWS